MGGSRNSQIFGVNITIYKSVNAKDSTYKIHPRSVQMHIVKSKHDDKEASKVGTDDNLFWPRLLQNKLLEKNQVNIDWNRYIDEDEENEKGGFDMSALDGGMGMGGMGMGGMGMGGMGMEGMGMEG